MMTQSVMTQAANFSGANAGASSHKSRQSSDSFELFMDRSLRQPLPRSNQPKATEADSLRKSKIDNRDSTKASQGSSNDKARTEARAIGRNEQDKFNAQESASQRTAVEQTTLEQTIAEQLMTAPLNMPTTEVEGTEEVSGMGQPLTADMEQLEQLLGILEAIQQLMMETLNLKPEEFSKLMEEQGLTVVDMSNPEALQRLLLAGNSKTDVMEFVTNDKLAAEWKALNEQLGALLETEKPVLTLEQLNKSAEDLKEQLFRLMTGNDTETTVKVFEAEPEAKEEVNAARAIEQDDSPEQKSDALTEQSGKPTIEIINQAGKEASSMEAGSDRSKSDTFDHEAAGRYETFLDNLTRAVQDTAALQTEEGQTVELKEIVNQILEKIKVIIKPEQTTMELTLNPEHLGRVNLTVQAKAGIMTAQFKVEHEFAREAIESQLQTLKDTLNAQGIKVEAIEVTITSYTFEQSSQFGKEGQPAEGKKQQGHKLTMEEAISMSEATTEEALADVTGLRGTNIDMTA